MRRIRNLMKTPEGMAGFGILATLVLVALFAPVLSPGDPLRIAGDPLLAPFVDPAFPLGTDRLGRDVLAGIIHGTRTSLAVGIAAAIAAIAIGLCVGLAAGFAGAMQKGDLSFCTYRGHAHTLARGVPVEQVLGELMQRDNGLMRGKGGSMHLTSEPHGVMGSYAIIGAHLPIACGAAWVPLSRPLTFSPPDDGAWASTEAAPAPTPAKAPTAG